MKLPIITRPTIKLQSPGDARTERQRRGVFNGAGAISKMEALTSGYREALRSVRIGVSAKSGANP